MKQRTFGSFFTLLVAAALLVVVAAGSAFYIAKQYGNPFDAFGDNKATRVFYTIERVQEIALLSLGVQEIQNDSENQKLFSVSIPGTTKKSDVQFSFQAKLGIDGSEVQVADEGNDHYLITILKFMFIGMDNLDIRVLNESNGVLSWATPDIDKDAMLDDVLKKRLQDKYIESNEELLREQAEAFYRNLVGSVAPEATVDFVYSNN